MDKEEYERRFQAVVESLKELPAYLAKKRKKREERRIFVNQVFGAAWQEYVKRKAAKNN
jgi:proline dehydrogenase